MDFKRLLRIVATSLIAVAVGTTIFIAVAALFGPTICHLGDHRREYVLATIKALYEAVEEFNQSEGRWPTASDGLQALSVKGYMPKLPTDPWWHEYEYRTDGQTYSLTSFGADGRRGGTGSAADIQRTFPCSAPRHSVQQ